MRFKIIAFTDSKTGDHLATLGKLAETELHFVEGLGLSAILAKVRLSERLPARSKKGLIKRLRHSQLLLEALLSHGPLIVANGDTIVSDPLHALKLIMTYNTVIKDALQAYGNKVQFQITVRWSPAEALQAHFGNRWLSGPLIDAGALIQEEMNSLKDLKAAQFRAVLEHVSDDLLVMPVDDTETLLNVAVMIERSVEPKLDAAVEAIDADMEGQLSIRYAGPLPALSFAAVDIQRPSDRTLEDARHILALDQTANMSVIKKRYHDLMRAHHPDVSKDSTDVDTARSLAGAYHLLMRVSENAMRGGDAECPMLVDIVSDKDRRAA